MRKYFKKIAFSVLLSMAVTMLAPAAEVAMAAKTFTYAEQNSGDKVTVLFMDPGEKVDLKFIGVPDYKNYTLKWVSSNEKVAVVDSTGMITAISKGTTTIRLNIGNGTAYTSTAVRVYVGEKQEVSIGTVSEDEMKSYTLENGKKVTLKAYGIKDMVGDRYTFNWSSTDTSVAKISSAGVVTAVAPGLTVIQLTVTKKFSGEEIYATPIALRVTGDGEVVPTTKPTVTPTRAPYATATPTPYVYNPTATPTPYVYNPSTTPVPTDTYVPYTASLETDTTMLLKFAKKVDYSTSDIQLYRLITAGSSVYELRVEIIDAELSSNGLELRITPEEMFMNGEKYIVRAGSADTNGTTVNVILGAPNRMEVTYSCLGKDGVAYAYDDEVSVDVPVMLDYRLFYGNIDVTDTYNNGYITYDLATNKYSDDISLDGEVLHFYKANITVGLKATYTYYDDNYNVKELKASSIVVRSQKLPAYGVSGVVKWTIADNDDLYIDWNKKVSSVIANDEDKKVVALIADTYGNYYCTDERGVDEENNIYSINDYDTLFSEFGYGIEFSAADANQIILGSDGSLYPYLETNKATILITLTSSGINDSGISRNIGACSVKVLAESKLKDIKVEESKIKLATSAIDNESRFCQADVEIILLDQYGNEWKGDYDLELTSTNADVREALYNGSGSPAWLSDNVLHIDAKNIKKETNKTSVTFTVTETTTKEKVTVSVTLQNPTTSNGEIVASGWSLGIENTEIVVGNEAMEELDCYAVIEAFKTTSNGVKVGLYDDLTVINDKDYKFTTSNCRPGEIYVLVLGPDGEPVDIGDSSRLGVYVDSVNDCVKVNVFAQSSGLMYDSLDAGNYTVKATRIISTDGGVRKQDANGNFVVKDETKSVTFRSLKSTKTSIMLSSKTDLESAKQIVAENMVFNLEGKEWKDVTKNMILDVEYVVNSRTIVIRSVEIAVPITSGTVTGLSYSKKVTNINKAITMGVSD